MFSFTVALRPKTPSVQPKGISTYNASTAGILDGADFMDWVTTQANNNVKIVALQQGAYYVNPSGRASAHTFPSRPTGVTVWMDDVNLTVSNAEYQPF